MQRKIKTCYRCKEKKYLDCFSVCRRNKDGKQAKCKACEAAVYLANREKRLKQQKLLYESKKEYFQAYKRKWHYENRERLLEKAKRYRENNRGATNAIKAKYRASKRKATPKWLTKDHVSDIKGFYVAAVELQALAGCFLQVDHIIPLQGKEVCGLHVPWNLQILTKEENNQKGTNYNDK